ncbi:unnamed protein product [Didymodactylos carnosus]|uniref:Reverse transcriptase domain-containing protein n=1 Tax=Didymodactylos carnosus TaxID=1234261 RepID=A0A814T4K6_9BILA|nr:unnamed protein product [Didymodactylos carnosus]CAF3919848.1 unnamed protein product [Didymodactylos carnosus]
MDSMGSISEQHTKKILSMLHPLTEEDTVLRASYQGYSLRIYSTSDFQRQSSQCMKQMGIYTFIQKINRTKSKIDQICLKNIVKEVRTILDDLFCSHCLTLQQYKQMQFNRADVKLNSLHFVLAANENNIVRPIMTCKDGPTMGIARYLRDLLWSIFHQLTGCLTLSNGANLVQAFELYSEKGYLQSTNLFTSFNINEFCNKFSHQVMIKALEHFLRTYGTEDNMHGLTIDTIIKLVSLVLQNQFFVYQDKLYEQTMGSASGLPLTIPLACIYIFYCQPTLLTALIVQQENQNELFGIFQDDLFPTWNKSEDELRVLLDMPMMVDEQHIQITTLSIGTTFPFGDVVVYHAHGILHSKIYHDPRTDQYQLRNKCKHGTSQSARLLHARLIHAV